MAEIGVIGSGSWGTALALVLNKNGHHVTIWSYLKEEADEIREKRENPSKLPGVHIPEEIEITTDLQGKCGRKRCGRSCSSVYGNQSYGEENVPVCKGRANSGQCGKRN